MQCHNITIDYLAEILGMHHATIKSYLCHFTLCKYVKMKQFYVCDESIISLYNYLDKKRLYKACDRLMKCYQRSKDANI